MFSLCEPHRTLLGPLTGNGFWWSWPILIDLLKDKVPLCESGFEFSDWPKDFWWRWILFWVKIIRFRAMYIYIVAIFCVKMGKIRKYIYSCLYIKKLERMQKNRVYLWWGVQEDTGQVEWRQVGMGYFHWLYPCVYFLFLNDVSIENAYWKNCNTFFKVRCFCDTMRLFYCWGFRARK